jgi:hypothetical protein
MQPPVGCTQPRRGLGAMPISHAVTAEQLPEPSPRRRRNAPSVAFLLMHAALVSESTMTAQPADRGTVVKLKACEGLRPVEPSAPKPRT